MKLNRNIHSPLLLMMLLVPVMSSLAQSISFRTLAPDAITLTKLGSIDLEFDSLVLGSDIVSSITVNDTDRLAILAIDAPAYYDLRVQVDMINGDKLILDGNKPSQSIPFTLEFAYANLGYQINTSYSTALADAKAVPPGFRSVSFPVSKGASGSPPPPLMPEYKGFDLTTAKKRAFLFFYGSVGPANAGNNVVAGVYETIIEVIIDFTNYDD